MPSRILERMMLEVIWWLKERKGLKFTDLARAGRAKTTTVRDALTSHDPHCFFTTLNDLCEALGRPLEWILALTRRWTAWRIRRLKAGHKLSRRVRKPASRSEKTALSSTVHRI